MILLVHYHKYFVLCQIWIIFYRCDFVAFILSKNSMFKLAVARLITQLRHFTHSISSHIESIFIYFQLIIISLLFITSQKWIVKKIMMYISLFQCSQVRFITMKLRICCVISALVCFPKLIGEHTDRIDWCYCRYQNINWIYLIIPFFVTSNAQIFLNNWSCKCLPFK